MQKFLFVLVITLICLAAQILFAQVSGGSLVPNFILIAVIFFNLYRGLRYSLGAAFLGGLFLDSYSGNPMGINIFSLVLCAFLTGTLKKYLYQPGVAESRVLVVVLAAAANSFLQYIVNISTGIEIGLTEAFWHETVPEVLLTALVASFTFERLKECALRLLA